ALEPVARRRELRGGADDDVPELVRGPRLLEEVERVRVDEADPGLRAREAVQLRVLARRRDRGLVEVDPRRLARVPEAAGGEREPARVAADVEDALPARELRERAAVVALVEEEARLVAARDVHGEADAVLVDRHEDGLPVGRLRLEPLELLDA